MPRASVTGALRVLAVSCILMWTLAACDGERRDAPVADSTMVDVLVELHLLNAREETRGRPLQGARDSLFSRYGIDSTAYAEAITYYANRPGEYGDIYGRVVDELASSPAPITYPDSVSPPPGLTPPFP